MAEKEVKEKWICVACDLGQCERCTDIVLIVMELETICDCTLIGHSVEPRDVQILDPETGTVFAPGLTVDEGGKVEFDDKRR